MNEPMEQLIEEMSSDNSLIALKAEFEAEGSRIGELIQLKSLADRFSLPLFIKIGGCEAMRDLHDCFTLGARGIIAPMIESPFACEKFKNGLKQTYSEKELQQIEAILNIESITAIKNIDEILDAATAPITGINIGLVDLSCSYGLTRESATSEQNRAIIEELAPKIKQRDLSIGFGGGLSPQSVDFIFQLKGKSERFETRKTIFQLRDRAQIQKSLQLASKFEYLYLLEKKSYYSRIAEEDEMRLEILKNRISQ